MNEAFVPSLRVTLAQQALSWEAPVANHRAFAAALAGLAGATDLVVLPEMFATGFTMETLRCAETPGGPTSQWMIAQARSLDCALAGSVITRQGASCFNRLLFVTPDGVAGHYDKRHLFRMGGEHEHFACGEHRLLLEWRGARIARLVCYDLRFPVWSRRTPAFDYDLLLYVANWPAARVSAWSTLLAARAIENQAYVAGVNRCGADGNGVEHPGASAAHDALGQPLALLGPGAALRTVTLDLAQLRRLRERFPAHLDADRFTIDS